MGKSHALTTPQTFTETLCTVMPNGANYILGDHDSGVTNTTNPMPAGLYRVSLVYSSDLTANDAVIRWFPRVTNTQVAALTNQVQGGVWSASTTQSNSVNNPLADVTGDYLQLTIGYGGGGSSYVQDLVLPYGLIIATAPGTGNVGDAFTLAITVTRLG